ncbi:MAG: aspartate 1-decarboxylase [Nannocystaceae bacterium]
MTRGTRLVTYALRGDDHSGIVRINGAAAHPAGVGDTVIIATFAEVEAERLPQWQPTVVLVDRDNRIVDAAPQEIRPRRRVAAG